MPEAEFFLPGTIPGVSVGWGAFETLLVESGRVHALADHWQRLEKSAEVLRLCLPSIELAQSVVQDLLPCVDTSPARLRFNLLAKTNSADTNPYASVFFAHLTIYQRPAGQARVCLLPFSAPHSSLLNGVKTTSYLSHALARHWALAHGYHEGLWLNENGHLIEGTASNLFLLNGRTLLTPPLSSHCLPGVTRTRVLSLARQLGFQTEETFFDREALLAAEVVFLTSSLREIQRVEVCDHHTWKNEPPASFRELLAAWAEARARA